MGLAEAALLVVVGIAGGALSALVGGASLVTFPVLIAAGLSPASAVATNMMALTPGNILAWIYDRKQLPPFDRSFGVLVAVSLVGAFIGALLLLATPARMMGFLVPVLMGFATVVFAYSKQIEGWIKRRAAARDVDGTGSGGRWTATNAAVFPVSVYGGYFGSGVGVLLIAVLTIGAGGDYRTTNVVKNFVTSLNSSVACLVFMTQGSVAWAQSLVMMVGALGGALAGARLAQVVPREAMRVAMIALSAALTIGFAWRYWF
jgi:uncharacterized protein